MLKLMIVDTGDAPLSGGMLGRFCAEGLNFTVKRGSVVGVIVKEPEVLIRLKKIVFDYYIRRLNFVELVEGASIDYELSRYVLGGMANTLAEEGDEEIVEGNTLEGLRKREEGLLSRESKRADAIFSKDGGVRYIIP